MMFVNVEVLLRNTNYRRSLIRLTLSCIFLVFLSSLVAQTPDWEWARSVNTNGFEVAYDVVADPSTNEVYMVGVWKDDLSAVFPAGANSSSDFTDTYGDDDGFVAKYDEDGNFIWAFKLGVSIMITSQLLPLTLQETFI